MRTESAAHRSDDFARRLRASLKRSGITQARLARLADIDQSSISRYLRGQCEPNLRQFRAIAHALKVKPRYLLGDDTDPVVAVQGHANGHFYMFVRGRLIGEYTGPSFGCSCVALVEGDEGLALLQANGVLGVAGRALRVFTSSRLRVPGSRHRAGRSWSRVAIMLNCARSSSFPRARPRPRARRSRRRPRFRAR
ncbi:helix-turn-helix transcriptional regulator [bacterium]|nr:helix-turn-helix transcriptional regulator [bacterium]